MNNPIKIKRPKIKDTIPKNEGVISAKGKAFFFRFSTIYFLSLKKEKLRLIIVKPRAILIIPTPTKLKKNNSGNKLNMRFSITNKKFMVYLSDINSKQQAKNKMISEKAYKKILVLDNIRSVLNIGAIFRTADAVGIDQIILVGNTPVPIDRFGRERQDIHKTALGAEKNIPWKHLENNQILDFLVSLQKNNFNIVSLEQDEKSIDYKKVKSFEKQVLILGHETEGVSSEILKISDQIAEIPMRGEKESLNVSVSGGIMMYQLFD